MVSKDRAGSPIGGGVVIICRKDWKGKALNVTDSLEFESQLETMSLCRHDDLVQQTRIPLHKQASNSLTIAVHADRENNKNYLAKQT